MSCTVCHYITGHAADCSQGLADRAADQDDLRARIEALEKKVDRLADLVVDYAHLKKLYAESREYVGTLVRERDDLIEANRRTVAENNHLDAAVAKLRANLVGARGFLIGLARRPADLGAGTSEMLDMAEAIASVLSEVPATESLS